MPKTDWIEVELGSLMAERGNSVNPKKHPEEEFELYSVPNHAIGEPEMILGKKIGSTKQLVGDGWVLLSRINPHLNRSWVISSKSANRKIASSEWVKFPPNNSFDAKYLSFFVTTTKFLNYMCANVSGVGGSLTRTNKNAIREYKTPLPPLPIQRAIVAKIEQAFYELDTSIDSLQKAEQKLKLYRQAVLKKAFEGGYSPEPHILVQIDSLCEVVRGGSPRPAGDLRYYVGNIPFLKVKDITRNDGIYIAKSEHTIKAAGLKKTRQVDKETLLLTNSGATLGVPAITKISTTFNDGIAAFLGLNKKDLLYHYYFWCSKTVELRNLNQGAAQPNLNTNVIGRQLIPIYENKSIHSLIVEEIESRLSVADKLQESITSSLQKAQALRQSILKKAFAGELLSESELATCKKEPDYEPAEELVKKIKNRSLSLSK